MSLLEMEFLEKIEKHKGVIFKISKMYMDNPDDQNDLYQEIIYQAWKSYSDFQKKSEFSTWLYRTALNTAIVFLRSEKKRSFIQNQSIENLSVHQESYNDADDRNMKLMYEAIHQLSAIDKALIFFYLEDFPGKEIAKQLGITEVNARVKLNRAKTKLKEIIEKQKAI
ncbi:sigma-70 family RNA polymerase sigma factor [Chryseobacterium gambrini]|uniref:Sigma-70 family RNA polymerase sigma factor n=1 Tax=Chryseobacterium gambrini TaxID=373672 RepID=A0AAJ1R609_9FLAO|nr:MULTISPECIES: sigma-70 family RNA polymerase sigma factor [Chryseobacterium]MDN4013907.1 sigma-70 family RNA polymerase sigma factor [Chryseobacterium gambrini]MDN4031235.1 sigma-70 family RNA polymerase sigma factor [Chryseobacterium gambrini]QWA39600.1 sigma-70 family RNA polymerase sigma factor [Chryseobacterium sp. ZHDP1]